MNSSVEQQLPKFIKEYLVYCDCFTDIQKEKTCWVLTRNLKFFEFSQKQLVATIDLRTTCLSKYKHKLQGYNGPKGNFYEDSNLLPKTEITQNPITFGKYIFHAINVYKTYVIIKCWDKCVVLKKFSNFKGFEVKAEYENLLSYRITHGLIKYCPMLELKFQNDEILKIDFEDTRDTSNEDDLVNARLEMRHLLERIRCAKAELHLHKAITAQSFYSEQNNVTLGEPFLRTYKTEEKQILGRCGDIWKRFTVHDDLVIGVPLVNQCAPPNLSIIRNLRPVLHTRESKESSIQLHYRLFQLKVKFDQLDELETLVDCEDDQLQEKIWCANGDLQLLPESFAVLLIKIKIAQIISLEECSLILNYEVIRRLHVTTTESLNTTFNMHLQLFLQNLSFQKLLFEERVHCEIKFLPLTLHQDLLTIIMTSTETNLRITFINTTALEIFERYLEESLEFLKSTLRPNCQSDAVQFNTIFYNKNPHSLWFGSLILHTKETEENDNNQCLTTWKFYCQNYDKSLLLIKTFLNDHLKVQCNIIDISDIDNSKENSNYTAKLENALRQELRQLQEIVRTANNKDQTREHIQNLEKLYQLQLTSDIIACSTNEI